MYELRFIWNSCTHCRRNDLTVRRRLAIQQLESHIRRWRRWWPQTTRCGTRCLSALQYTCLPHALEWKISWHIECACRWGQQRHFALHGANSVRRFKDRRSCCCIVKLRGRRMWRRRQRLLLHYFLLRQRISSLLLLLQVLLLAWDCIVLWQLQSLLLLLLLLYIGCLAGTRTIKGGCRQLLCRPQCADANWKGGLVGRRASRLNRTTSDIVYIICKNRTIRISTALI